MSVMKRVDNCRQTFYRDSNITKEELTKTKAALENNKFLHNIDCKEGIIEYAFNEKHFIKILIFQIMR